MARFDEVFGEEYSPEIDLADYKATRRNYEERVVRRRKLMLHHEVGEAPPLSPEIIADRERYKVDFVALHREVFPESTGQKPFGPKQQQSIQFGQDVFTSGGRLLKLEPRGYAKTTRITNEALAAVLLGLQDYVVIICSNMEKAAEILESLKTELYNNEQLERLFPGPIACIKQIDEVPARARYQTYGGERTHLYWGVRTIRFAYVPNEPSSGKFIEVRPMTNVKGLHKKLKIGPDAGKVVRPTLFLIDDPQTHDDASSSVKVRAICSRIKRDALRGGSHSRRASAIMSITPVCPGDVAWHFEKNEQSWEIVKYKMLEKYPDNHDWWMSDYAKVYLDYDRTIRGDKTRAAVASCELLRKNWDFAHAGCEVTWEYAYAWDETPQTEISALQHAYNIILDDGIEDFEYECQCNTEYGLYQEGETIHAPINQIMTKTLPYKRNIVPQRTAKIVAHIDVNKDFLSYLVLSSDNPIQPHVLDYGTYPKQPGIFTKRNMLVTLGSLYPHQKDYRDILYLAIKDLVETLATRKFIREDGMDLSINQIGVDIKYEEQYVTKAIKESLYRHLIVPCSGLFVGPDDELLHEKAKASSINVWDNCYLAPNRDHTLDVFFFDTNYFKTEVHRGFNLEAGVRGSLTIFGKEDDGLPVLFDRHKVVAEHCNIERPEREIGKRTGRTRITWKQKVSQPDNEYLDNLTNCFALLYMNNLRQQLDTSSPENKELAKEMDMNAFMQSQSKRRNLLGN
jgi:hypothetical protein